MKIVSAISWSFYCLCKVKQRQTDPLMSLAGLNETILHCLGTIYQGWHNTMLILTETFLLSLVPELLVLFASHRSFRHLLPKPNSFQAHQLFSACCLQETSEKLWWWLQLRECKCKCPNPNFSSLIIVTISLYQQFWAELIKRLRLLVFLLNSIFKMTLKGQPKGSTFLVRKRISKLYKVTTVHPSVSCEKVSFFPCLNILRLIGIFCREQSNKTTTQKSNKFVIYTITGLAKSCVLVGQFILCL